MARCTRCKCQWGGFLNQFDMLARIESCSCNFVGGGSARTWLYHTGSSAVDQPALIELKAARKRAEWRQRTCSCCRLRWRPTSGRHSRATLPFRRTDSTGTCELLGGAASYRRLRPALLRSSALGAVMPWNVTVPASGTYRFAVCKDIPASPCPNGDSNSFQATSDAKQCSKRPSGWEGSPPP